MTTRYLRLKIEKELNKEPLTKEAYFETLKYFNFSCAYCGKSLFDTKLEKDHIIALCKGGLTKKENIIPACRSCNASKNASNFYNWYIKQPFFTRENLAKIDAFIILNSSRQPALSR